MVPGYLSAQAKTQNKDRILKQLQLVSLVIKGKDWSEPEKAVFKADSEGWYQGHKTVSLGSTIRSL